MTFDWTISLTGVATVLAALFSPLIALRVSESLHLRREARTRKIHVFRTLMSTRASALAVSHVEALNLIDIEFDSRRPAESRVTDAWHLYLSHLNDVNYALPAWGNRRVDLLIELLYDMSSCVGYNFDKAQIKDSSYIPRSFGDTELEQGELRRALLSAFKGGALKVALPPPPPAK